MESLQADAGKLSLDKRDFAFCDLHPIRPQESITTIKHRMAVQRALDLIRLRFQNPPTLAELAFFAGLSRTYFSPVFKEIAGMGLRDYLTRARINKAQDLLGDLNLTVKQIAYQVGFTDPNYFSRTFKKETGVAPTTWRLRKMIKIE